MKKLMILLILIATLKFAASQVILDNYIGADPTHHKWDGKDIIGYNHLFNVQKMEIDFINDLMIVDVYSTYFDNIGKYQTQLGDLFISTDGYNPVTPTENDSMINGEDWEYVITLDDHLNSSGGTASLYSVNDAYIIESWAPNGYIYRADQEVQYDTTHQSAIDTDNWTISADKKFLRFTMPMLNDWQDVTEFGFHWGMTCANDVIEGSAENTNIPPNNVVPEPMSVILFILSALGIKIFKQ